MSRIACPLCGSPVRVSEAKPYSRLLCKKCHSPFHLNKTGVAVVGSPPDVEIEYQELKQKIHKEVAQFPVRKVVYGLTGLVVLWMVWHTLFRPGEGLEQTAGRAARAVADNAPGSLRSLAASGTADDAARWYEAVHPQLVQAREAWGGKAEAVEAHLAQEDKARRTGSVGVSIHPAAANARDVSLADPTEATASRAPTFDVTTDWVQNRWGRWELDGRATYARVRPSP